MKKGFELATKAHNLRLHLEGDTFQGKAAHDMFKEIVRKSYYVGRPHEFLILANMDPERDVILKNVLKFNYEKLIISVTYDQETGNPSELHIISTMLVINNLPQIESQSITVTTIKRLYGKGNIVGVGFDHTPNHKEDKQCGWCHMQCLTLWSTSNWWTNPPTYFDEGSTLQNIKGTSMKKSWTTPPYLPY